ncbi:TPA: hypothetical protein ACHVE4_002039 [Streptococcus suis]
MSDTLQNFNNLYANLAQSAYPTSPLKFPIEALEPNQRDQLKNGNSVRINFSVDQVTKNGTIPGGQNLPNNGVVYLQPDPTLRSVPKTTDIALPQINGGYQSTSYPTGGHYQKGLLTDEPAGFNAYFLTDTPTLSSQTKNAYFAVRGSDGGFDIGDQSNWNDWIDNNDLPWD